MYPGTVAWWKKKRAEMFGHGSRAGCGRSSGEAWGRFWAGSAEGHSDHPGAAFGVRRPLRFLAYKLDLDEAQVGTLAKILDDLKTERAQAAVDNRRTLATFADLIGGESFDTAAANEAAATRVRSAERLREAVVRALERVHEVLRTEQREKLAYLIRTGTLTI